MTDKTETPFLSDELRTAFLELSPVDQLHEITNRVGSYYDTGTAEKDYRFLRQVEELATISAETVQGLVDRLPVPDGVDHEREAKFWIELREPWRTPERKGPFPAVKIAETLREFMAARPTAYMTVVTLGHDGPLFEDAPQALMSRDGRSRSVALRHIETCRAAHAAMADQHDRRSK